MDLVANSAKSPTENPAVVAKARRQYYFAVGGKAARVRIIGKNKRLRVAIGEPSNRRSHLWRIWVRKSDAYVTTGGPSPTKFSFHESGICRDAFTAEFGAPPGMDDRAMKKWKRGPIPPPNTEQGCSVLEITIPTDFLS